MESTEAAAVCILMQSTGSSVTRTFLKAHRDSRLSHAQNLAMILLRQVGPCKAEPVVDQYLLLFLLLMHGVYAI